MPPSSSSSSSPLRQPHFYVGRRRSLLYACACIFMYKYRYAVLSVGDLCGASCIFFAAAVFTRPRKHTYIRKHTPTPAEQEKLCVGRRRLRSNSRSKSDHLPVPLGGYWVNGKSVRIGWLKHKHARLATPPTVRVLQITTAAPHQHHPSSRNRHGRPAIVRRNYPGASRRLRIDGVSSLVWPSASRA